MEDKIKKWIAILLAPAIIIYWAIRQYTPGNTWIPIILGAMSLYLFKGKEHPEENGKNGRGDHDDTKAKRKTAVVKIRERKREEQARPTSDRAIVYYHHWLRNRTAF